MEFGLWLGVVLWAVQAFISTGESLNNSQGVLMTYESKEPLAIVNA